MFNLAQAAKGGEDAFFVSTVHRGVIAVSDGVSGWAAEGVDPADYSRSRFPKLVDVHE